MGEFSKKISKRIGHVQLKEGFCLICGIGGKLSQDHIPPQCCVTIKSIEQRLASEMMGPNSIDFKGVRARNGSSFRTICQSCNNKLGVYDKHVGEVYKKLTLQITNYFGCPNNLYNFASVPVNAISYARSMIGHMLAATSDEECRHPPCETSYFEPLKKFVLGDDSALDGTHDIYYWFYPRSMHISAKFVTMRNNGHQAPVSVLSFFPVAFMVTLKNQGIYPAQAIELKLQDKSLIINLSTENADFVDFPFVPLAGDQMYALNDSQAIISYPVKK